MIYPMFLYVKVFGILLSLRILYPFPEGWCCFLTYDNGMILIGNAKFDQQFYFFKGFKTSNETDINNVMPVGTEKNLPVKFIFQFS